MITSFIAATILGLPAVELPLSPKRYSGQEFKVTATRNPLDLVIFGGGYFSILTPIGKIAYSTNGQFHIDGTGQIVNRKGYPLYPQVTMPEGSRQIMVGMDGLIECLLPGAHQPIKIDTISTFKFRRPNSLKKYDDSTWFPTMSSGTPIKLDPSLDGATIYSGYIPGFHKSWTITDSNGLTTEVHK